MRRPNFPLARRTYSLGLFQLYKGVNIARLLVNETARSLIGNICILMDLSFDPENPRSGLTLRKIQKVCAQRGVASPGRVFAFVKMLEFAGFLEDRQRRISASSFCGLRRNCALIGPS